MAVERSGRLRTLVAVAKAEEQGDGGGAAAGLGGGLEGMCPGGVAVCRDGSIALTLQFDNVVARASATALSTSR